ncbi:MAG: DUF3426 domain-containing protein [Rhodoferax sp.]
MNFITRCPACGTMFKVVPDQLRISDGWVRCGQCAEVFEAPEHLQLDPTTATPPAPVAAVAEPGGADRTDPGEPEAMGSQGILEEGPSDDSENLERASQDAAVQALPATLDKLPEADSTARVNTREDEESASSPLGTEVSLSEPQPEMGSERADAADPVTEGVQSASPETSPDLPLDESAPAPVSDFLSEPSVELVQGAGPVSEPTMPEVSFVRAAQRSTLWQRPQVRRLLGGACALLLVSLGLQVLVQERDRIAAFQPRSLGLLQALCVPLRCEVKPLRQIESIVVDSSSFRKVRDNVYELNLGIKNGASTALAMPSIELALTDSQDQPVLRRVLSPAQLGATAVLAAGADWSGSLPVGVADSTIAARIEGYRVLAFYP